MALLSPMHLVTLLDDRSLGRVRRPKPRPPAVGLIVPNCWNTQSGTLGGVGFENFIEKGLPLLLK